MPQSGTEIMEYVKNHRGVLLLDGAMGTMLQGVTLRPGELPELLCVTRPKVIEEIHSAYLAAGSEVVYTNTFGANPRKLAGSGHSVREVVFGAVSCARRAADSCGHRALVALDIGPLGELLQPLGSLPFEEAVRLFAQVAEAGERAGADLAVIETMTDLQEARAALLAVRENTGLPVWVTMSFDEGGRTFTGCEAACMAHTLEGLGADAIGVNCSLGPKELLPVVRTLRRHTRLPLIAKPNAGLPDPVTGEYSLSDEDFAVGVRALAEAGASIVGGCCGTTPSAIKALRDALEGASIGGEQYEPAGFVCSASRGVALDQVRVIGERINPTGKKAFQQALLSGDISWAQKTAVAQADMGAELLDVNVGHPGVDEGVRLRETVQAVQAVCDLPIQLDSTDPQALESALRVYCGKAAVNSVNGTAESLSSVLPVVKKYGAAVVGLTLDEKGLPHTAEERLCIARRILDAAVRAGIPKEDVWIDCLTLTVSAEQSQAEETLQAVRGVTEQLGLSTVLGVSNVSFGLPARPTLTAAFLLRALDAGLTLPIINPSQTEVMDAVAAYRALHGEDAGCTGWVQRMAGRQSVAPSAVVPGAARSAAAQSLGEAIQRGLQTEAAQLAQAALGDTPPLELVEKELIPALNQVGADYEAGRAYLPQLLSAAQAAQAVFQVIRAAMPEKDKAASRGKIIVATVQGDIHDIGKNIVKTVLENYGYEVIDLGRDVPPQRVVEEAERQQAALVGLSALMTTTLPAMRETARQLFEMKTPPRLMVGGAVVTEEWAGSIGAMYAKDAQAAVRIAEKVFGNASGG